MEMMAEILSINVPERAGGELGRTFTVLDILGLQNRWEREHILLHLTSQFENWTLFMRRKVVQVSEQPFLVRTMKTFLKAFCLQYRLDTELSEQEIKWCLEIIESDREPQGLEGQADGAPLIWHTYVFLGRRRGPGFQEPKCTNGEV